MQKLYPDAAAALARAKEKTFDAVISDYRMPGMDGLTLQKRLLDIGCSIPAVVMTGHGNVESAREAFRAHAVDFLEKPIDHTKLMRAIAEAFQRQATALDKENRRSDFDRLLTTLTPREKKVMDLVVTGRHNREIAESLGISARTVEVHKARMMTKLGVDGVPDLVRLSLVGQDRNNTQN